VTLAEGDVAQGFATFTSCERLPAE
jgi:hypothetical protein